MPIMYQPYMPLRASDINRIFAKDLVGMPSVQRISETLQWLLVDKCHRPCMMAYSGARFDDKIMRRDVPMCRGRTRWFS